MKTIFRTCSVFAALFALIAFAATVWGQGARPSASPAKGMIRGHVADPSGALIPGAQVTITTAAGASVAQVTADTNGAYQATGLAAGSYIVKSAAAGFSPAASPVFQLLAGQSKRVDIAMAILAEQQSVTVTDDDTSTVSVEAGSNASSVTLKDKDLDSLSDDPDELSSELSALAGPAAGPNGGEVYIGGFSGGQLPPKSAIREIRVNQNPFSSEFDHLGYGRIEILTKPGTDQLHGRFFLQGNDDAFNTKSPFPKTIPAYHSLQYNGSLSGSINKNASFFFDAQQRTNQNASIYNVTTAVLNAATKSYSAGTISGSLFNPSEHTLIAPRIDVQLGQKHTLTARYQFERYHQSGSIDSQALPDQSTDYHYHEHSLQLSDSYIVNDRIVNETRFQYLRDFEDSLPVKTTPTVSVSGSFTGGGASSQKYREHEDHLELWNITTMTAGTQAIKFGTRLRWDREAMTANSNFNGSFVFSSVDSYLAMLNGQAAGESYAQIAANGGLPSKLTYTRGQTAFDAGVFDGSLFFQDDWKANQFLTLSGGLRWESQNHLGDHSDWGPRVAFAYALDGHKKGATSKTVLRGGYGFFYDRFGLSNVFNLKRYSGGLDSQSQSVISNPTCFSATELSDAVLAGCGTAATTDKTITRRAERYQAPYTQQLSLSLERQISKSTSLTITGLRSYGVHQMATRNANAYKDGTYVYGSTTQTGTRPDPSLGIVKLYDPEAIYKQNQLIVNFNTSPSKQFSFSGFYNLNSVRSNTGTASNAWNLKQDYKRASWAPRHMVFLMGSVTTPLNFVFNPFLIAQSGKPYNFVSPYDLTGDNFFVSRPALVEQSSCSTGPSTRYAQTRYGCFDMQPAAGTAVIPGNMGNSSALVAMNLRLSRAFGFGAKTGESSMGDGPHGGPMGPGFGGMRGGHGPRGGLATGRKYSLTFSAQALNLFNNVNYGTPVGTVNSSIFGQATSLASGIFSSGSASRRVFFQTAFTF